MRPQLPADIIPLTAHHIPHVQRMLQASAPWHMIAYDAFQQYGIRHPHHHWYVELLSDGQIRGAIYVSESLVHFVYEHEPPRSSAVYYSLLNRGQTYVTYGKKELLQSLTSKMKSHDPVPHKRCRLLVQTDATVEIASRPRKWPPGLQIVQGQPSHIQPLQYLLADTEFGLQTDWQLVSQLLAQHRVWLALCSNKLCGVIMILKETPRYTLLGNLFVTPEARYQGVASALGQCMLLYCLQQGKKACLFYDQPELASFYERAAFKTIGEWWGYTLTSKAML